MHIPQVSSPFDSSPLALDIGAKKTPTKCSGIIFDEKRVSVTVGTVASPSGVKVTV